ncbi:MAG: GGDEF domain-containing protein [Lachnospiraceae bacterium]|nr:GGDEF domain-containing protein [Lachnospiraceae bacterium]
MKIKEFLFDKCAHMIITTMDGEIILSEGHYDIAPDKWKMWLAPNLEGISQSDVTEWEIAESADERYFNVQSFVFDKSTSPLPFDDDPAYPDKFAVHMLYDVSTYAALFKDLSVYSAELNRLRKQIQYEKEHDFLTGIYNRGKFAEFAKEEFRNYKSIALYNLDVNYLKRTNDTLGHEAGNRLLLKTGESIKAVLNDNIYGFRMGGDEFLIVAADPGRAGAEEILSRWQEALSRVNEEEPVPECVVACGMAYAEAPYDFREVMDEADKLMYENKRAIKISRGDDLDSR